MASSISDVATKTWVPGPSAPFPIAPDDTTRRMLGRWHKIHGDIYRVPAEHAGRACWVVHDPDVVQQVLVRRSAHYAKGIGLDRIRMSLGNGIMVSEGDFWARQRRLIQPAFKPRALGDFNTMIAQENAALAQRLAEHAAAGDSVEMAAHVSQLTLSIVLKSIFGADYSTRVACGDNPFALLAREPERDLSFAARFRRLTRVVDECIESRIASSRHEFDFLGHLLAARTRAGGEPMSRSELIDEVMTLIVAGHETTASVLTWAWFLLATHPAVCKRLQAEVDAIDASDLSENVGHVRLDYTDQVVRETLRLYPPGWLLSRRSLAADRLGEHAIERDTQVFISPYILHRHEAYWRDPERFDPARFARNEPAHRFAYVPFAAGPRHCVGEHMAMTEMRVHLATLLRRFTPRYLGAHPPVLESRITLRPRDGIYLQLSPR